MAKKWVYHYGGGSAEGDKTMKNLLGGKGANLAEMAGIGLPVPPGFTITTEVCTEYMKAGAAYPAGLKEQVAEGIKRMEELTGKKYGDPENPLLVSVRSGARISMPGMMETVLNVGLTSKTMGGLIKKSNERFTYDAYRRLLMMYSDVVMEKAESKLPIKGEGIRPALDEMIDQLKKKKGYTADCDITAEDWKVLVPEMKKQVNEHLERDFPDDAEAQLWGAISAVFSSWNGDRAIAYRNIEKIPHDWGTAVNIVAMVFGNMGESSATGVGFSRNPATGDNHFYGEWLVNAQGEDVVAGIRTPAPINIHGRSDRNADLPTLEEAFPVVYKELYDIQLKLEKHYRDMQDIEFTIEAGKLYMLQCRVGKRNGVSAIQMAVDMVKEGMITETEAIKRIRPSQVDEVLHPMIDPVVEKEHEAFASGLPAGPGAGVGIICLTAAEAERMAKLGKKVVLVRTETSPEDVAGMHCAEAIVTAKGGMTSHAALVARGWGKCCVVGCSALNISLLEGTVKVGSLVLKAGDTISVNGTRGRMYEGALPCRVPDVSGSAIFELLKYCDKVRRLGVRANADTPQDGLQAVKFGAEGIGLTRTEHMFFEKSRIRHMREMIVAKDEAARDEAVMKLLPYQRADFYGIFKAMEGRPVTIRLLDPPLHEFVPNDEAEIKSIAAELGVTVQQMHAKIASLHELNPMMGHRGCRLGVSHPIISRMQATAIFQAAARVIKEGGKVQPEVMIPLITRVEEYLNQEAIVRECYKKVSEEEKMEFPYKVGTMIETPRATVVADKVAEHAEFFSFGTNDLTQMTFGFSRDDVGSFLPYYIEHGIIPKDPFASLDQDGVGVLLKMAVDKGKSTRPDIKLGICGEHGGDPDSIDFCHRVGLTYVSCSPFRVPIARFSAALAALRD